VKIFLTNTIGTLSESLSYGNIAQKDKLVIDKKLGFIRVVKRFTARAPTADVRWPTDLLL